MPNDVGRPPAEIDLELLAQLARIHCTDAEMASILGVCLRTFATRKAEDPEFLHVYEKAKAEGCRSLRRSQWELAEKGNATAQIWLGKQVLGQRDVKHLGEDPSAPFRGMEIAAQNTLDKMLAMAEEGGDDEADDT